MSYADQAEAARAKADRLKTQLAELVGEHADATLPPGKQQKKDDLLRGIQRADEEHREALLAAAHAGEYTVTRGDNPPRSADYDSDPYREPRSIRRDRVWEDPINDRTPVSEVRSRAFSAIEKMSGASDAVRETATKIIEEFDDERGNLSRLALVASDPDYVRAFMETARNPQTPILSEREVQAIRRVRYEARAMSLTDTSGGFLVPFQLDPTVIQTSDGSTNPIRNLARKVVATSDIWNGVSSPAVSWSWDPEATQVSDDSTTFAGPAIPVHKSAGFVPISLEAIMDAENVAAEVGKLLAFGKDTLESAAFTTGSGTNQPTGLITALSGTASTVAPTTGGAFGAPDVYLVDEALPARYRARASWLAHRTRWNDLAEAETTNGSLKFPTVQNRDPSLLNRPAYEASDMSSTVTTGEFVLLLGDFEYFVVADRIGTVVEFIPHIFGANQRPTGQRGWYAWPRTGSDSVNDGAFRILQL